LRLLQLVSPTLPIGAFAYSDGLETAVGHGWIGDEAAACAWIGGRLRSYVTVTDLPVLARLMAEGADRDRWALLLRATRDSGEARAADRQLGQALARLLRDLEVDGAEAWIDREHASLALGFALAGRAWQLSTASVLAGYAWSWTESQVAAAIKLVPLGQTAGQRILAALGAEIPALVTRALSIDDDDIGATNPAVAMASAWHERDRVRLFRS
jgi:urease accessory protein